MILLPLTGMAEDFDSQDVRVIGVDCKYSA